LVAAAGAADSPAPKENVFATKPLGIRVSIKMDGPYMEAADLQIICLFKHKALAILTKARLRTRTHISAAFCPHCEIAASLSVNR